jgi:hypothetical protein
VWAFGRPPSAMLKKLYKMHANVDSSKLVAQRERQANIDTKKFENAMYYIIVDASKCSLYGMQWFIKRKQLISMGGWTQLSGKI